MTTTNEPITPFKWSPFLPQSRKQCQDNTSLSQPKPIQYAGDTHYNWNHEDRLKRDCGAVTLTEKESQKTGVYQLSGFDPTPQSNERYANRMSEIMHFQKVYRNQEIGIDAETRLQHSQLNNLNNIQQLSTRPYLGFYSGPGTSSLDNKDLESSLQQGLLTNLRQKRFYSRYHARFECLPEYGNPQRIFCIEPPPVEIGGWVRGGDGTRDLVRRIDYLKRCQNAFNNKTIIKH